MDLPPDSKTLDDTGAEYEGYVVSCDYCGWHKAVDDETKAEHAVEDHVFENGEALTDECTWDDVEIMALLDYAREQGAL